MRIEPADAAVDPFSPQAPSNEGQITICAWVKVLQTATDGHGQERQPIVMKGGGGEWEYALYVNDDFGAGMSVWNCAGSGVSEPSAPGALIPDQWHHVCGTFDVDLGVTVYVDAIEVAQSAPNGEEPCDGTQPVLIGSRVDGQFLNAQISEVAIWNRVLELAEIEANMGGDLATQKEDCEEVAVPCSVQRTLSTRFYEDGDMVPVTLSAGNITGPTTISDTFPDGWSVADAGGGTVNGNTITFAIDAAGTSSYVLLAAGCAGVSLSGTVMGDGGCSGFYDFDRAFLCILKCTSYCITCCQAYIYTCCTSCSTTACISTSNAGDKPICWQCYFIYVIVSWFERNRHVHLSIR